MNCEKTLAFQLLRRIGEYKYLLPEEYHRPERLLIFDMVYFISQVQMHAKKLYDV